MLQLLTSYSLSEILIFIVILALALKGLITFYDWAKKRLEDAFAKENNHRQSLTELKEELQAQQQAIQKTNEKYETLASNIAALTEKMNLLIASDKDDIKSYITKEHHYFCYQQKWIDDYSLDCLEKRFNHYEAEGGNSFIEELMNELRDLPKTPQQ